MPLLTPTKSTLVQSTCPVACHYAEHDGKTVLRTGEGRLQTFRGLLCADTAEALAAEIARLHLTPLPPPVDELAADYFRSLEPALQEQFAPLFQAVSAVRSIAEKIRAIEAVTVPEALAPTKARLLEILRGTPAPAPLPTA